MRDGGQKGNWLEEQRGSQGWCMHLTREKTKWPTVESWSRVGPKAVAVGPKWTRKGRRDAKQVGLLGRVVQPTFSLMRLGVDIQRGPLDDVVFVRYRFRLSVRFSSPHENRRQSRCDHAQPSTSSNHQFMHKCMINLITY